MSAASLTLLPRSVRRRGLIVLLATTARRGQRRAGRTFWREALDPVRTGGARDRLCGDGARGSAAGASTANGTPAVLWLIIGGVGAISTAGLWLLNQRQVVKTVAPEDLVVE